MVSVCNINRRLENLQCVFQAVKVVLVKWCHCREVEFTEKSSKSCAVGWPDGV